MHGTSNTPLATNRNWRHCLCCVSLGMESGSGDHFDRQIEFDEHHNVTNGVYHPDWQATYWRLVGNERRNLHEQEQASINATQRCIYPSVYRSEGFRLVEAVLH